MNRTIEPYMAAFWKKKKFWGSLIGLVLLAYCVKDIRASELQLLLQRANLYYLIAAVASGALFIVLKAVRWRMVIAQQKQITLPRAITLYSVGQVLGMVMPALTGQVGRVVWFARKEGLRKTYVFSTLVLEILFDSISLIVFMFLTSLAFAFPSRYRYLSFVVAGITAGAVALLYIILHMQERLEEIARCRFRDRWPGFYITCKKFIRSFTKGIELLRSSQGTLGTLALSLASWAAHMLVVWFLIRCFGLPLPFAAAAVIMIVNTIVLMVPISPGNAGTFEVAVSTSLAAFSVGRSDAVLFALALHIVDLLPVFIFGYFFMHTEKLTLEELKAVQAEEDLIIDRIDEEGTFIEEKERV
ncbi:MAG: lysylphosphatidylglycerol synthase transmembrane domain-containing protein [Candidatus Zixiibacteriota bacterium]